MKKIIFTSILFVLSLVGFAQGQEVMVIEKNDKSTVKINVDEIERITFQSINVDVITVILIPSDIHEYSVESIGGGVYGEYPASTTCGIIYGTTEDITSSNGTKHPATMDSFGTFLFTLSGLTSNTTYYYRAYAEIDGIYFYGEVRSFTTKKVPQYNIGDFYPQDNAPIGIVWWTDSTGEHGKLLSLTQTSKTWNSAFTWCTNYGSTWSLPSAYDFGLLVTALINNNNYSKMNSKLRESGYDILQGVYWSSGENYMDNTEAYAFVIENGNNMGNKITRAKKGNGLVRAIRTF